MKTVLFTLTSARSGTLYLRNIFRLNVRDCVCRHEPFFDWGNPTLFGRAVYDAYAGRKDRVRSLLIKKRDYIERKAGSVYLESSHAFLKSAYLAALDIFPDLRLIHLIRDPLKVAKSEAYRETWRRRVRAPFHYYVGDDGKRHFAWALTGNEEIFRSFDTAALTMFQWYLIQWIELENRAIRFLDDHQVRDRCFTLHTPADLNSSERLRALFNYFGLVTRYEQIVFGGRKNKSIGRRKTTITETDQRECDVVLEQMPSDYLRIFEHEPYARCPWAGRFHRPARSESVAPAASISSRMATPRAT